MRRREFLAALLLLTSAPVLAQGTAKMYRLGVLGPGDASSWVSSPARIITVAKLAEYGFLDGGNLQIEPRYGSGPALPELARELVATRPDAIIAISRAAILAAHQATKTIPIVMSFFGEDPVAAGLVASFSRPGGNVTGLIMLTLELDAKRLELLREAVPEARRIAVLLTNRPEEDQKKAAMEDRARQIGVEPLFFPIAGAHEYAAAFRSMRDQGAQVLVVGSAPEFFRDATKIARLALDAKLPTICEWREMATAGCLLGYGPNLVELRHRTADYVARIFRGAAPGDLPIDRRVLSLP